MKASLKSDTFLYGAAVMVERLLGLLLLPLLTRRLTPDEYGIWTQTLVVSSVMMPLVLVCLPQAIVAFFASGLSALLRRRWMLHMLALASAVFAVLWLAAWLWAPSVASVVYGDYAQSRFVAVLLALVAADALFDLLVAYLRAAFRMRDIALMLVVRGSLRLGLLLIALDGLGMGFANAFAAVVLLQLGWVSGAYLLVASRLGDDVGHGASLAASPVTWRTMLDFAAPLVAISVLTSVNGFGDRFVLAHTLGLDSVAVYSAAASLVSVTNVAYTVLGFALFPVLARHWAQGDQVGASRLAGDAVRVFLFLTLPFVVWLACVISRLLPLLATQAYQVSGEVALLLGAAAVAFGLFQIRLYLLLLSGQGTRAAWLMLLAALVNLALNLALVPRHGPMGAALAAAVSNSVLAAVAYLSTASPAEAPFPWAGAARIALAACVAGAGALMLGSWPAARGWTGIVLSFVLSAALYLALDLLPGRSVIRTFVWHKDPA